MCEDDGHFAQQSWRGKLDSGSQEILRTQVPVCCEGCPCGFSVPYQSPSQRLNAYFPTGSSKPTLGENHLNLMMVRIHPNHPSRGAGIGIGRVVDEFDGVDPIRSNHSKSPLQQAAHSKYLRGGIIARFISHTSFSTMLQELFDEYTHLIMS